MSASGQDSARTGWYRPVLVYAATANLAFYVPVLLLYFRQVGLSATEAYALVGVYSLVLALTDLPTGVLADALGARAVLIASSLVGLGAALVLAVGSSFLLLALGQGLVALGLSLRSGALSAYLYELAGRSAYTRAEGRVTAISYLALAVSAMLGGALFAVRPVLVFATTAAVLLISALALSRSDSARARTTRASPAAIVRRVASRVRSDRQLSALSLLFAILTTLTGLAYWSYQLFLDAIGTPVALIGPVYACSFLASAIGARYAAAVNLRLGIALGLSAHALVLALALLGMSAVRHPLGILLPLFVQLSTGYLFPTFYALLQEHVADGERATLLSLESTLQRLAIAFGSIGFGWLVAIRSLSDALLLSTGCCVLGVLVLAPLTSRGPDHAPLAAR